MKTDGKFIIQSGGITQGIQKELGLTNQEYKQIAELHNDVAEIKKENQAIHDIATSVKLIAQDMSYVKDDVAEVKSSQSQIRSELSEVKNAPIKSKANWVDKVVGAVCGAVGMAVLAYVLNAIAPQVFK